MIKKFIYSTCRNCGYFYQPSKFYMWRLFGFCHLDCLNEALDNGEID